MTMRLDIFVVASAFLFVALAVLTLSAILRARRASETSWPALLARLKSVDRGMLARVASDFEDCESDLPESSFARELDPREISDLIGGMDGLSVLEANCDVLIEMAFYVQRWHPEALLVAEELRLNAREIKWHVSRLQGAAEIGKLETAFPSYGQRAAAVYYRMTQTLLALYETVGLPEATQLQSALQS